MDVLCAINRGYRVSVDTYELDVGRMTQNKIATARRWSDVGIDSCELITSTHALLSHLARKDANIRYLEITRARPPNDKDKNMHEVVLFACIFAKGFSLQVQRNPTNAELFGG